MMNQSPGRIRRREPGSKVCDISRIALSYSDDRDQGMNARRERRREKREIVNPKKRKVSPERDSGEDEPDEGGKESKKKGAKPKKQKIPAGLALMHGFSATNVGKSRLTVSEPIYIVCIPLTTYCRWSIRDRLACFQKARHQPRPPP